MDDKNTNNTNIPEPETEEVVVPDTQTTEQPSVTVTNPNPEVLDTTSSEEALKKALIGLGFINFDSGNHDNNTSEVMVSEKLRKDFRRDVYVGIKDEEQNKEFLGRVVEGPFYFPHEVGADSSITRTTVLYPDRTKFRPTYFVNGNIEILGELIDKDRLNPSTTRPRPYSEIYIFPEDRLSKFLDINGNFFLGGLLGYDKVFVKANSESKNFIPRNIGIFGTVGSGKSNTTQVLIEEALKDNWAVVTVDVEGEYVKMNEPTTDLFLKDLLKDKFNLEPQGIKDMVVYTPKMGDSNAEDPKKFKVPVSKIDFGVLSDLLELTEPQQRMLEKATSILNKKDKKSDSRRGVLGNSETATEEPNYNLDDLLNAFSKSEETKESPILGKITQTEEATLWTMRAKLGGLARSGLLDSSSSSATPYLPIYDILVPGRLSVLDISEVDDRNRNLAIAYVLQALFDEVISTPIGENMANGNPRPKVLVVIEEVHTFVSKSNVQKMKAVLDNLQVISRRGRKRWMGLALVSQQPGHVPDELFELCNTRFIHQLKSISNLEPIKRTTGGVHEALWSNMASLGPGQCLITGAVFKNPLFVAMRPAQSRRLLID